MAIDDSGGGPRYRDVTEQAKTVESGVGGERFEVEELSKNEYQAYLKELKGQKEFFERKGWDGALEAVEEKLTELRDDGYTSDQVTERIRSVEKRLETAEEFKRHETAEELREKLRRLKQGRR